MTGWQDDYETAGGRRDALYALMDARMHRLALQRSAPAEARHAGTDDGAHHWAPVTGLACPCGCMANGTEDSDDPIDVLGRQVNSDPLSEQEDREYRRGREYQRGLAAAAMRELGIAGIMHEPSYGRHFGGDGAAHHRPDGDRGSYVSPGRCPSCQAHLLITGTCPESQCKWWGKAPGWPE